MSKRIELTDKEREAAAEAARLRPRGHAMTTEKPVEPYPSARVREALAEAYDRSSPLTQRLRAAADTIEELNSMSGYDADAAQRAAVSAKFLREEADELEKP